ncbi:MAG: c-type cytochrome [Gammaproteobacteria bacterium]|nr:c-type cytochrome [Gammaproteobacteria bacterium]
MSFALVLNRAEIEAVVDYVRNVFIAGDGLNTRYHILENGWDDHERYALAFPFALGEIALDTLLEQLTEAQREGRQLFISSCVTCHDRSGVRNEVNNEGDLWKPRSVSYPRGGYSNKDVATSNGAEALLFERGNEADSRTIDAISSATPFARHEIVPQVDGLTPQQQLGETIFQANCAFCHGATGTGRNWVGSFLQPSPRDLSDAEAMAGMSHERLTKVITNGLADTTMSAWGGVLTVDEIDAVAAYVMRVFVPSSDNIR